MYSNIGLVIRKFCEGGVPYHRLVLGQGYDRKEVILSPALRSTINPWWNYIPVDQIKHTFRRRSDGAIYLDRSRSRDKAMYLVLGAVPPKNRNIAAQGGSGFIQIPRTQKKSKVILEAHDCMSTEQLGALSEDWQVLVIKVMPAKEPLVFATVWRDRMGDLTTTLYVVTYDTDTQNWHVTACQPENVADVYESIGAEVPFGTETVERWIVKREPPRVEIKPDEWVDLQD